MEFKSFEFKTSVDETGEFEGLLSVYGNVDQGGDVVDAGAFTKSLQERGSTVPLLWQHDTHQPIGSLQLSDSPTALRAKGRLILSIPQAKIAYDLLKAGVLRGLSIGYLPVKQVPGENGVRRLKELALHEGSLVTFPMNERALVASVKAADEETAALNELRAISQGLRDFSTSWT